MSQIPLWEEPQRKQNHDTDVPSVDDFLDLLMHSNLKERAAKTPSGGGEQKAAVRQWARDRGIDLYPGEPLPNYVLIAYHRALQDPAPPESPPR
ncbi:hypothetical protein ACGF0J_37880 [Nonomuraea sp. NPDC047897]|uniref:hypothetical protein n=1 Tax=Nonomuraea sp. NPDC047897 TaxID=3364346 RepID=UPI00371DD03B